MKDTKVNFAVTDEDIVVANMKTNVSLYNVVQYLDQTGVCLMCVLVLGGVLVAALMTVTHGGGVMSHVEEALLPPSAGFFDALGQKAPYCHCCVAIRFMWRSVAAVSMCTHTHTHTRFLLLL